MGTMTKQHDKQQDFEAYSAEPSDDVKGAVIVVHEAWGLTDHIRDVADRFAAEGYAVMAPELLEGQEITKHADELQADMFDPAKRNAAQPRMRELMAPLHDSAFIQQSVGRLKSCFDVLAERPDVEGRVAVIGFSFGGTYAYQLAAAEPLLKAAVPFYGHAPLNDAKLGWITCPVLAFYGERDEGLMSQLPAVEQAMHESGVDIETKVYTGAGHAFFNDTNPLAYNEAAAQDAWQRTLDFLDKNLTA